MSATRDGTLDWTRLARVTCALLCLLPGPPALARGRPGAPAPVTPLVVPLADGSELVLALRPQAAWASLHYVVRSGSRKDPQGKEGLAHLLEHVLFHGSHDVRGEDFQQAVKEAGGDLNGFTSAHATTYVLRAPADAFLPLAGQLVRIVTSPQLDPRHMQREVEIIRTEGQYFSQGPGFQEQLEDSLFESQGTRSILGSQKTLESITRDDLADFYARHYTPANTSIVITGGVKREDVDVMLERSVRLAPSLPGEFEPTPVEAPVLPIEQTIRAYFSLIAYGYAVAPRDVGTCPRAAALLELRLTRELNIEEPVTMGLEVRCMSLRGNTFLMALAFSASLDASTLPDHLRDAFSRLARQDATAAEDRLTEQHRRSAREQEADDDRARGEELARRVAQPREGARDPVWLLGAPERPARGAVRDFARRTFVPERRVLVHFSPFAG